MISPLPFRPEPELDASPPSLERLAQALGSMPTDAVLSHRSAAALWGLWIAQFDDVEVTTVAGARGSRETTSVQRKAVVAHRRLLHPSEVTVCHGLPVTTLTRTWLDLAPLLDIYDLVAAGDSALRAGATAAELERQVRGGHRIRGVVKARLAGPVLDGRSRSRPESRMRAALVFAGLPLPRVNEPISDDNGGWLAEPDLHYPEARLALEYNGADHASLDRMRKDATRLLGLQRAGWEVRTYTAPDAFLRLDDVVSDVRRLLRARAPQLLVDAHFRDRVTDLVDRRRRKRRHSRAGSVTRRVSW